MVHEVFQHQKLSESLETDTNGKEVRDHQFSDKMFVTCLDKGQFLNKKNLLSVYRTILLRGHQAAKINLETT